jgi:protein-tyrosine phosphatase
MVIKLAPAEGADGSAPFRVLVVSDRSTSRGPAVQRLLGAHLRAGGWSADVALTCAGVRAGAGEPMQADTARALAELDVDAGGHVARRLTERRVVQADLVLTVARRQARAVAELRPGAAHRTFTVHEFARLAAVLTGGTAAPAAGRPVTLAARVAALDELRTRPAEGSRGLEDDIADPSGGGYADHRRMVRGVDAVTLRLARALTPPATTADATAADTSRAGAGKVAPEAEAV